MSLSFKKLLVDQEHHSSDIWEVGLALQISVHLILNLSQFFVSTATSVTDTRTGLTEATCVLHQVNVISTPTFHYSWPFTSIWMCIFNSPMERKFASSQALSSNWEFLVALPSSSPEVIFKAVSLSLDQMDSETSWPRTLTSLLMFTPCGRNFRLPFPKPVCKRKG